MYEKLSSIDLENIKYTTELAEIESERDCNVGE